MSAVEYGMEDSGDGEAQDQCATVDDGGVELQLRFGANEQDPATVRTR